MSKLVEPYVEQLNRKIDAICPNISNSLDRISSLDLDKALAVLGELVAHACQGTHASAIVAGRTAIAKLPAEWLERNLHTAVRTRLDLNDDWEFQRLLELLKEVRPAMMAQFVTAGFSSSNPDVREAAQDWATGVHGPVEGLTPPPASGT